MAKRAGFTVSKREPATARPSPNATVRELTVEIRCHWPAHAGNADAVRAALTSAYSEALQQIARIDTGAP